MSEHLPSGTDQYQSAASLYSSGRFAEALAIVRPLIFAQRTCELYWDLLNLAGACSYAMGQKADAEMYWLQFIKERPNDAGVHSNLGNLLMDAGRLAEAEAAYRRALELKPDFALVHYNLGLLLGNTQQSVEAEAEFHRALGFDPDFAEAHCNLGHLLQNATRSVEAEASYRRALELKPDYAEAHYSLANLLRDAGRPVEAEASFRHALELKPDYAEAHYNLANLFQDAGRPVEAEASYRRALELKPDYAEAHGNLGNLLQEARRSVEAEASYRRALEYKPDLAKTHSNLGNLLMEARRPVEAEASYRRALEFKPDLAEVHNNLGILLLALGRYGEAWQSYEARYSLNFSKRIVAPDHLPYPQWQGERLANKTLVLWAEQGLGDQIQFVRYVPLLKRRGVAHITLVCDASIKPLLETVDGVDVVVTNPNAVTLHDYWSLLMSLPLHFGTTLETIPNRLPYLRAPVERVGAWRPRLASRELKVGLVWAGNPRPHIADANAVDRRRSMHVRQYLPLLQLPGIEFFSLQKGEAAHAQLKELPAELRPQDLMSDVQDFGETAAIGKNLDLLITVDTSMAHLAGAINKPVWVLSRFDGCWRWLQDRDDSPWYPGILRLFRQERPGDWDAVIANVTRELSRLVSGSGG
jgi:Flp pilus assembly protein TadD